VRVEAFQALDHWFLTPQGKAVSDAFVEQLAQLGDLVQLMRGELLLQLGNCGEHPWLNLLHYSEKCIVAPHVSVRPALHTMHVLGIPKYLPFDQDSIDCIVSPLTLDTYHWPHHPIDEIDRVLKPMGYLVIFGVNAVSLWGLAMRLGGLPYLAHTLMRPTSIFRLKHALLRRGYSLCHLAPFYYIPPVKTSQWIERLEIFNELGKMAPPCPGGFYCMVVQKYVPQNIGPLLNKKYWQTGVSAPDFQPVGYGR
jgi:hypothetical protein